MISVNVKETGLKDFNKSINEYLKWSKKQPAEIVNAKLYFISLQAMRETKMADKAVIRESFNQPSEKNPKVSIGSIVTAMDLKQKGKQRGTAAQFAKKVQTFLNKRASHTGFLRSGWLPAIKMLDFWNKRGDIQFTKRFAPKKPDGVKEYGKTKGNVIPARLDMARVKGTIFNLIGQGKQDTKRVHKFLQDGLDAGVRKEIASMRVYVERKINEYHARLETKNRYKG